MNLNRKQHPTYNKIENIDFPRVKKIKLDNNIPAYIINGGSQELLKLDVMVNAGAVYSDKKLIAPLTGLMLNEGTHTKTAHEIAEVFDFYGAYFQPMAEKDMAFCGLFSLSKHIHKTLPLFNEIINNSIFPEKELEIALERRRQNFLIDMEKTSFVARELFNQQLFGALHPYGKITSEADYKNITREELLDFYKTHYNAENYALVVSGRVTDNDIELINQHFGKLKTATTVGLPNIKLQTIEPDKPIISIKENAVQSSIIMGLITINKTHSDYLGLKVLSTILGGYFGSRLMKNIREDKGYTYGIHAMQVSLKHAGFLAIAADVKFTHTKQAVDEIKKEVDKLRIEKISHEELNLVRNYMMGEMLHMFDGPLASSDSFRAVLQYNMGFEYFDKMKQTILTITSEQLQTLAIKYLDIDKLITVVVGKF